MLTAVTVGSLCPAYSRHYYFWFSESELRSDDRTIGRSDRPVTFRKSDFLIFSAEFKSLKLVVCGLRFATSSLCTYSATWCACVWWTGCAAMDANCILSPTPSTNEGAWGQSTPVLLLTTGTLYNNWRWRLFSSWLRRRLLATTESCKF